MSDNNDILSSLFAQIQKNFILITLVLASVILRYVSSTEKKEKDEKKAEEESKKAKRVNHKVKLDQPKVVDTLKCPDIETLEACKNGKVVMRRCWKSEKFPYCDGAHNKHNQETGDNVGPLIIDTGK